MMNRLAVLAALLIVAALGLDRYASAPDPFLKPGSLNVRQAQKLDQPSIGFSPAPYTIDPRADPGVAIAPTTIEPDVRLSDSLPADAPPGGWTDVNLPHASPYSRLKPAPRPNENLAPTTITWYRLQTAPFTPIKGPRYLYIPRWKAAGRIAIYADSRLLYQSDFNLSTPLNAPIWIPLDNYGDASPPDTVTLRIQHLRNLDSALSTVWVGTADALRWRYQWRNWLQNRLPLASSVAFLAMGIFVLFVWRRNRSEKLYLLFALMSVAVYVRSLRYYVGADWIPLDDAWFTWADVTARFVIVFLAHLILVQLHGRPRPWLQRTLIVTTVASSLLTLPFVLAMPYVGIVGPLIYLPLLLLGLLVFGTGIWDARSGHSNPGMLVAAWGLLGVTLGVHDWLMHNNLVDIDHLLLGAFVNVGACLILMYLVLQRYMAAIDNVVEVDTSDGQPRLRVIEQRGSPSDGRRRKQEMRPGLDAARTSAVGPVECGQLDSADVADILKECVEDLKLSIDSSESADADLLLLLDTLRFRLGPRLDKLGIALRWEVKDVGSRDSLAPRVSLHILRILLEAFTNIIKHAHATEICVATAETADGIRLTIIDNGVGFALAPARQSGGSGLQNQLRRAKAIGARVRWTSAGRGTCFLLWLPTVR